MGQTWYPRSWQSNSGAGCHRFSIRIVRRRILGDERQPVTLQTVNQLAEPGQVLGGKPLSHSETKLGKGNTHWFILRQCAQGFHDAASVEARGALERLGLGLARARGLELEGNLHRGVGRALVAQWADDAGRTASRALQRSKLDQRLVPGPAVPRWQQ